nr:E3 ubiquitin-protein ligase FANCL isoform X2 [Aegilops tauschii subsp. strangulata]
MLGRPASPTLGCRPCLFLRKKNRAFAQKERKSQAAASRSGGRATAAAAVGPLESWCYPPPPLATPELTRALRRTARGKRGRRARADRPRSTAPCSRRDEQRRHHLLEITLPMNYPACPPSIAADVPYLPKLQWSESSRLKDVLCQFQEHLKVLQDYWSTMDGIDKALWVVDPTKPTYAMSHHRIALGDDCYILLHVDTHKPNSLPECRFLGTDGKLERLIKNWRKNRKRWSADRKFHENLATVLDFALPQPPSVSIKDDQQADCGICYATHLPVDDELGTQSGCAADYKCENPSCSRAFHSVCLRDWLRTITTTRQSFDVLFGNCPYCSEPVAVKSTDS